MLGEVCRECPPKNKLDGVVIGTTLHFQDHVYMHIFLIPYHPATEITKEDLMKKLKKKKNVEFPQHICHFSVGYRDTANEIRGLGFQILQVKTLSLQESFKTFVTTQYVHSAICMSMLLTNIYSVKEEISVHIPSFKLNCFFTTSHKGDKTK